MKQTREEKAAAARARMAELAGKFIERSATDIAAMRENLSKLESGDSQRLAEIRHLAHRMVGTGATLGFESLSDHALRIEQLAESCGAGACDDITRARIAAAIEALDTEYQRQRDRGTSGLLPL